MIAGGGYGFGRSLASRGYGVGIGVVAAVEVQPSGGFPARGFFKYPEYRKWKIKFEDEEEGLKALYKEVTAPSAQRETRLAAQRLASVFAYGVSDVPEIEAIDWSAFLENLASVEKLILLQRRMIEDETVILAYMHYFH